MSLNRLSDKLVFNILAGINVGYLEITNYHGEVFRLGNPQNFLHFYEILAFYDILQDP